MCSLIDYRKKNKYRTLEKIKNLHIIFISTVLLKGNNFFSDNKVTIIRHGYDNMAMQHTQ